MRACERSKQAPSTVIICALNQEYEGAVRFYVITLTVKVTMPPASYATVLALDLEKL